MAFILTGIDSADLDYDNLTSLAGTATTPEILIGNKLDGTAKGLAFNIGLGKKGSTGDMAAGTKIQLDLFLSGGDLTTLANFSVPTAGGWLAYAHVQAIGTGGESDKIIGPGVGVGVPVIPEPGLVLFLITGLFTSVLLARRWR